MNEPTELPDTEYMAEQRRSFLLRLWCTRESASWNWRASLEDPHTGERIGFADLEHLFNYLMELTEASARHKKDR